MLFSSYEFVFGFVPMALIGFVLAARWLGPTTSKIWLLIVSALFYVASEGSLTWVILVSILTNFAAGAAISASSNESKRRATLAAAILFDLLLLGWFKYSGGWGRGLSFSLPWLGPAPIYGLPLGISFFTFQQIAYLLDSHAKRAGSYPLLDYSLFVLFFPQVTSGPINYHYETLPQYQGRLGRARITGADFAVGLTLFAIGLYKKVILAQSLSRYVAPVYSGAVGHPSFLGAWSATLAYTFDIYFDFSGYSDMAIGIARIFGVRLPINFNSPFKATSLVEFWSRWHMTMTRFFTDYLYTPAALALTRRAMVRHYPPGLTFFATVMVPSYITFVAIGIWHGAGWTFVIFGSIHAVGLIVNRAWRQWKLPHVPAAIGWGLTFGYFVFTIIFFRSRDVTSALSVLRAMAGLNAGSWHALSAQILAGWQAGSGQPAVLAVLRCWVGGAAIGKEQVLLFASLAAFCLCLPNSIELLRRYRPALNTRRVLANHTFMSRWLVWRPNLTWSAAITAIAILALLKLSGISEFIYFAF